MSDNTTRTRKDVRRALLKELIAASQESQMSDEPWAEQLAWVIEYMLTSDDETIPVMAEEFIKFVETAGW